MTRLPDLTAAEFNLMKVLWRLGHATVAEARAALGGELAYTTVMTLLGRLAAKGAAVVDRDREPYVYRPAFRRESVLRERLRQFVEHVFDGDADSLVLGLVEGESLTLEELRGIERRIEAGDDAARTTRGKPEPRPRPRKDRR